MEQSKRSFLTLDKTLLGVATALSLSLAMVVSQTLLPTTEPYLVASMGASAVILLLLPESPFSKPWPFIGSHLVCALTARMVLLVTEELSLAVPLTLLLAITGMQLLRCLHPPGAATALGTLLLPATTVTDLSGWMLLVFLNCMVLLVVIWGLNRCFRVIEAHRLSEEYLESSVHDTQTERWLTDLIMASPHMLDISAHELKWLLGRLAAEQNRLHVYPLSSVLSPVGELISYHLPVAEAWKQLRESGRPSIAVIDQQQRLLGVLRLEDFLNHMHLENGSHWSTALSRFLKPSQPDTTSKPEVAGHLMSKILPVLTIDQPLLQAINVLADSNEPSLPVVDEFGKLTGWLDGRLLWQTQWFEVVAKTL